MPARCRSILLLALLLPSAGYSQVKQEVLPPPKKETLPPPKKEESAPPPVVETLPALPPTEFPPFMPPAPGCQVPVVEKTVPMTKVLLVPHEQATTMPAWKLRSVEVGRMPGGPVLDFHEEKQCVTEMRLEEREVEQQVVCNESKPITVTDPCTGQSRTEYELCPVVKTVKVKVYEVVPVQREVLVRVPYLKPGPELAVKKLILHEATVPAVERTYQALTTQHEAAVVVPVAPCPIPSPHP